MDLVRNFVSNSSVSSLFYLVTVLMFIFGLKLLQSPKTARKGNMLSAVGMLIAITVTLLDKGILNYTVILIVLAIGSVIGIILAYTVDLRSIPQFVAVLNGFGGAVSAIVGVSEFLIFFQTGHVPQGVTPVQFFTAVSADAFIGTITFWGSMVAFAKLQGILSEKSFVLPGKNIINALLLLTSIVFGTLLVISSTNSNTDPRNIIYLICILGSATFLGLSLTMAVGGADMPIIIALFIAYAGLSAGALGFTSMNYGLIMVGSLVGASGLILTKVMAKAINRNFYAILLGNITPPPATSGGQADIYTGKIKTTTPEEFAMMLDYAKTIVIIPGYGLAVSQAQSGVRDLFNELTKDGKDVYFAIHPVAGRMPGHMNVLLAEVDIPYDRLKELDESNEILNNADIAIVIGANDVVNPMARDAKDTPIYGMPILNVDKAKTIMVIKRSLSPGFSGIPNPLFILDQTVMMFKDAKPAIAEIVKEYKDLKS
jgi:H+-translocating NAD(P) transhydrogenase subunit beta